MAHPPWELITGILYITCSGKGAYWHTKTIDVAYANLMMYRLMTKWYSIGPRPIIKSEEIKPGCNYQVKQYTCHFHQVTHCRLSIILHITS